MYLKVLNEYLFTLGWVFALIIMLSIAFPMLVLIADKLLGKVDLIKEIKKKNTAAAVLAGSLMIGAAIIIGLIV